MSDLKTPSDGPEHDAWLREALRHAPDAAATPPVSLREAILAEARAATKAVPRTVPSHSLLDRLLEFWSWLARPPVAAGFASVMAATLVGLMWWDRPMDEALPQPPAPRVAATPAPAQQGAQQAPVSVSAAPTPAAAPAAAATEATTQPPAPATAPVLADRAQRRTVAPPQAAALQAAPPQAAPAERSAVLPATPAKTTPAATDALREGRKDAPAPTPNAAPRPTPVAPSPFPARDRSDNDVQPAPGRSEPAALAKKAEKSDQEEKRQATRSETRPAAVAPSGAGAAPTGALGRSTGTITDAGAANQFAAQAPPVAAARQRAAAAETATAPARPMAPLLAELASETTRWSRPGPTGENVAVDAALRTWLARVDAESAQWRSSAERASRLDSALASTGESNTVVLNRDGRTGAIVRIEDAGVVFEPRSGPAWFAPLAPDVVARLRATLPAAGR